MGWSIAVIWHDGAGASATLVELGDELPEAVQDMIKATGEGLTVSAPTPTQVLRRLAAEQDARAVTEEAVGRLERLKSSD